MAFSRLGAEEKSPEIKSFLRRETTRSYARAPLAFDKLLAITQSRLVNILNHVLCVAGVYYQMTPSLNIRRGYTYMVFSKKIKF